MLSYKIVHKYIRSMNFLKEYENDCNSCAKLCVKTALSLQHIRAES